MHEDIFCRDIFCYQNNDLTTSTYKYQSSQHLLFISVSTANPFYKCLSNNTLKFTFYFQSYSIVNLKIRSCMYSISSINITTRGASTISTYMQI